MKKQLQQELTALAKRIIQKTESREVPVSTLKEQARQLYEKLSILEFTEQSLAALQTSEKERPQETASQVKEEAPTISKQEPVKAVPHEVHSEHHTPDGTEYREQEAITEPNTEKIKDIVAQMPPESDQIDQMLSAIFPRIEKKEISREGAKSNPQVKDQEKKAEDAISNTQVRDQDNKVENTTSKKQVEDQEEEEFGVHFDRLPLFEPLNIQQKERDRPKSVNDRLKRAIHIGLNDRHAFVKHLFGGSTSDYNRVLSQLNTHKSKEEALNFIEQMVKPDYNNWEGKELYENRFLNIIENRFA